MVITVEPQHPQATLIQTGVEGLDEVLRGGLVANRLYLVEGTPGSGKTTLALQFLLAGARLGEACMYRGALRGRTGTEGLRYVSWLESGRDRHP